MTPEVESAIEELKKVFVDRQVDVDPDADGGAFILVHDLFVGTMYEPEISWVGFRITFQYPRADVYPHFLDPSVRRKDGSPLGQGFSEVPEWHGRKVIQVSRRSNRLNPATDSAATKLAKVLEWIRTR